jgi:hypothetical protein
MFVDVEAEVLFTVDAVDHQSAAVAGKLDDASPQEVPDAGGATKGWDLARPAVLYRHADD